MLWQYEERVSPSPSIIHILPQSGKPGWKKYRREREEDTGVPRIQNNTHCPARAPLTSSGQGLRPTVGCQGNVSRL